MAYIGERVPKRDNEAERDMMPLLLSVALDLGEDEERRLRVPIILTVASGVPMILFVASGDVVTVTEGATIAPSNFRLPFTFTLLAPSSPPPPPPTTSTAGTNPTTAGNAANIPPPPPPAVRRDIQGAINKVMRKNRLFSIIIIVLDNDDFKLLIVCEHKLNVIRVFIGTTSSK